MMSDSLTHVLLAQVQELQVEVRSLNAKIQSIQDKHYEDMKGFADSFANLSINVFQPPTVPQVEDQPDDHGMAGGELT